ncbi:MAG: NFACT family protein [Clostridia bacterium]|nr:NFACT family protein [Clostridia bacterium]
MATDGLTLYANIIELQSLVGGKIDKVQQPNKDMILLHVHCTSAGRLKLMLCIHAENGRIQAVSRSYENPDAAPAFCMLLRKYLIGCRIASVEQAGLNRIAVLSLSGRNEFMDAVQLRLVVELMGRHGNLFLLDGDGRIIDCMRRFGLSENSARVCLPGMPYEAPPEVEKADPFRITAAELNALGEGRKPSVWLCGAVAGVSKLCAEQIVSDETPADRIADEIASVFDDLKEKRFSPSVVPGVGVLPFQPRNAAFASFATVNEAQDAFYQSRDEEAFRTKLRTALKNSLEHARKRTEKKLQECMKTLGDEAHLERDRVYGELLLTYRGACAGKTSVTVTDYYADPPASVDVPLDPKYSVQENSQRYFKRYRKNKAAYAFASEQVTSLNEELDYLKGQLLNVSVCTTREELAEIREELVRLHYVHNAELMRKSVQHPASKPLHYRTASGVDVFVGKNNLQNERLVRNSDPDHIWMHVKNAPASHVVLCTADPSREDLAAAAEIAAYHSSVSASENVPVDYTKIRFVKKPAGAKPGFVNYFHQHTLYVTPSQEAINPYRIREDV